MASNLWGCCRYPCSVGPTRSHSASTYMQSANMIQEWNCTTMQNVSPIVSQGLRPQYHWRNWKLKYSIWQNDISGLPNCSTSQTIWLQISKFQQQSAVCLLFRLLTKHLKWAKHFNRSNQEPSSFTRIAVKQFYITFLSNSQPSEQFGSSAFPVKSLCWISIQSPTLSNFSPLLFKEITLIL